MGVVITSGVDVATAAEVEAVARKLGQSVRAAADPTRALAEIAREGDNAAALVVGSAPDLISVAQQSQRLSKATPVLLLAQRGRKQTMLDALRFAPFVGDNVRCVEAGDITELGSILHDVVRRTELRRRHDAVIAASNRRLAEAPPAAPPPWPAELFGQMLELSPIAIVALDDAGSVRAWNRSASQLLRREEPEAVGRPLASLFPPNSFGTVEQLIAGAAATPGQATHASVLLPMDGHSVTLDATAVRVVTGAGRAGVLLLLQDASDRMQLVDALRDAVRIRDEFLAIAAHELKTPVTAIRLQVQGLNRRLELLDPAVARRLASMDRAVSRLLRLVDSLLDLTRISGGRVDLEWERVDLSALVGEVTHRIQPQLVAAGCTLELEIEPGIEGSFDQLRVEQILTNLLSNAVKFGAGAPVTVRLSHDGGGHTVLVVRDHGIGIPAESAAKVFERFERGVSSKHYGGLGLGLWISKQLVEAMGGTLELDSPEGGGAAFILRLPLEAAASAPQPTP